MLFVRDVASCGSRVPHDSEQTRRSWNCGQMNKQPDRFEAAPSPGTDHAVHAQEYKGKGPGGNRRPSTEGVGTLKVILVASHRAKLPSWRVVV